jgi:hypothetical protein
MTATRASGALVAATISLAIAALGSRIDLSEVRLYGGIRIGSNPIATLGLVGVPVVGWLGWLLAPVAAHGAWRPAIWRAVLLAVLAVVLGSVVTVAVGFALELPDSNLTWTAVAALPYLLAAPIVGMVLFGPPVLALTLPASFAWLLVLRAGRAFLATRGVPAR